MDSLDCLIDIGIIISHILVFNSSGSNGISSIVSKVRGMLDKLTIHKSHATKSSEWVEQNHQSPSLRQIPLLFLYHQSPQSPWSWFLALRLQRIAWLPVNMMANRALPINPPVKSPPYNQFFDLTKFQFAGKDQDLVYGIDDWRWWIQLDPCASL